MLALARIAWREGRFPKAWLVLTATPGIVGQLLRLFGVEMSDFAAYLPQPAWWWGLVVLGAWGLFIIYSMATKIQHYETRALDIRPFLSALDGSWWIDILNTSRSMLNSCVIALERLENDKGERVFPRSYGISGRAGAFPLRGLQTKNAQLASMQDGKIILHLLSDGGTYTPMQLEDANYRAVLTATSLEGAHCEKRFTLSRNGNVLHIS
jgi:hypothetical protein